MDAVDRRLINALQGGFPVAERPYALIATEHGLDEDEVIRRLEALVREGVLSRFGPLFDAERLGGGVTLAALSVPPERFEAVASLFDAMPEVAHNYAREHAFNMWFVIAAERPERVSEVIAAIERASGLEVLDLPREAAYFLGTRFAA